MTGPAERIEAEVSSWPGVDVGAHRFGGIEFRYGRRELGHLHGDRFADLPAGKGVKQELIADGRARPHHVLPDSGWVTVTMQDEAGEGTVLELLRANYDRALAQERRRTARQGSGE
ncbi:MAG TPA: luciferase family protein [Solirubrobacterales bacterium]|nr:luciferase family protein [Solirubrobacterales bacterium]